MFNKVEIKRKIIKLFKKCLYIPQNQSLSLRNFYKYLRIKYGPYIWREKIKTSDIIAKMQKMGMSEGRNIFIHCSWDEFYNYIGNERELIEAILKVIGPEGTLIMPAFPLLRKGKIFNVSKTATAAGLLAEEFRKYPGVKRSINLQHSVCAIGPQSDFLLSEHHNGETCWDEKSPYYRLSEINTLVFTLGLRKYYIGTMVHCVESILRKEVPYFKDFYETKPTIYSYVDVDQKIKTYMHYELTGGSKQRINKYFGTTIMCLKYFDKSYYDCDKISNLIISVYHADKIIPKMIELGKKGITMYKKPSKKGYKFNHS